MNSCKLTISFLFFFGVAGFPFSVFGQKTFETQSSKTKFELASGSYEVNGQYGEHEIAGVLKIENQGSTLRGQLTLQLRFPMHFAIRSTEIKPKSAIFRTSSPAIRLTIQLNGIGETWTSELSLTGDRNLKLIGSGERTADLDERFVNAFKLKPWDLGQISNNKQGQAFVTFSADGKQAFVSQYKDDFTKQEIFYSEKIDQEWAQPSAVTFSSDHSDRSPVFSADANRLYFASSRPLPGESQAGDFNLWVVDRLKSGAWSAPKPVEELNSDEHDYQPFLTRDNTVYFSSKRDGNQDLFRSKLQRDGKFSDPEKLSEPVNSENDEMSCCVDAEQTFIIVCSTAQVKGSFGNDDLFVSFVTNDGWTKPINLGGQVNSFANEYAPVLSTDGKYLYFSSDRSPPAKTYRVRVEDIEALVRPRSNAKHSSR